MPTSGHRPGAAVSAKSAREPARASRRIIAAIASAALPVRAARRLIAESICNHLNFRADVRQLPDNRLCAKKPCSRLSVEHMHEGFVARPRRASVHAGGSGRVRIGRKSVTGHRRLGRSRDEACKNGIKGHARRCKSDHSSTIDTARHRRHSLFASGAAVAFAMHGHVHSATNCHAHGVGLHDTRCQPRGEDHGKQDRERLMNKCPVHAENVSPRRWTNQAFSACLRQNCALVTSRAALPGGCKSSKRCGCMPPFLAPRGTSRIESAYFPRPALLPAAEFCAVVRFRSAPEITVRRIMHARFRRANRGETRCASICSLRVRDQNGSKKFDRDDRNSREQNSLLPA